MHSLLDRQENLCRRRIGSTRIVHWTSVNSSEIQGYSFSYLVIRIIQLETIFFKFSIFARVILRKDWQRFLWNIYLTIEFLLFQVNQKDVLDRTFAWKKGRYRADPQCDSHTKTAETEVDETDLMHRKCIIFELYLFISLRQFTINCDVNIININCVFLRTCFPT